MFIQDNLVSPVLQILHIHHQEAGGRIFNLELSDGRDSTHRAWMSPQLNKWSYGILDENLIIRILGCSHLLLSNHGVVSLIITNLMVIARHDRVIGDPHGMDGDHLPDGVGGEDGVERAEPVSAWIQ
jgi:hypothetical protein